MDKAIDSRSRILKQCNGVALSILFTKCKETPTPISAMLIKNVLGRGPVQWFVKMAFLMSWVRTFSIALRFSNENLRLLIFASEMVLEGPAPRTIVFTSNF